MLATDDGYVIATGTKVVAIDSAGHTSWKAAIPKGTEDSTQRNVQTTGGSVIITYGIKGQEWPGLEMIKVLDARTGKLRWQDKTTSFASVWGDTLYSSVCTGKQKDHIGDCTLTARDPKTGSARWSVATYASSQIEALDSGHVLEHAYPTGAPGSYRVRDATTGQALGPWVSAEDAPEAKLIGDTLVVTGKADRDDSDGCKQTVRGYSLTGDLRWRRSVTTGKDKNAHNGCYTIELQPGEDGLLTTASYDGVPQVLDAKTGSILWHGTAEDVLPLVSKSLVIVVSAPGGSAQSVHAVDPGSAKRAAKTLWSLKMPAEDENQYGVPALWTLAGSRLIGSDDSCSSGCQTLIVSAGTGRITTSYDGSYLDHGRNWLTTYDDSEAGGAEGPVTYRVYPYPPA